jgi:hypothetical protein
MPGYAGRQSRISLKGEVSNHKGIFDEIYFTRYRLRKNGKPVPKNQGKAESDSLNLAH